MRILFCNYEYPPLGGGGGVINALLAEELAKRHEVTVLTSRGMGLPAISSENDVRVVRAPVLLRKSKSTATMVSMLAYVLSATRKGRKLVEATEFDVINTHFVLPTGPVGAALARKAGIPNVLSVHGGDLYDPSKYLSPHRHAVLRSAVRRLLLSADRVVAQSANTAGNVSRYYNSELDVSVIPLAIRRPPRATSSRADAGLSDSDFVMVTVGRLVARKATEQLIELLLRLVDVDANLLVLGDGPERERLEDAARRLGVEERVRFCGYVSETEKYDLLHAADVYVSTSQHEGFGLVFLEAMACGLPVVCYDNGGQTDFLTSGQTGYVIPLNDTMSFEARCRDLAANRDLRSEIGNRNLLVSEEYLINRCAARYEELFQELATKARS